MKLVELLGQIREQETITKRPEVKFTRKDILDPKRLKAFSYHGTTKQNANKILASGSRRGLSITGNYEEAISYAIQRAGTGRRDAVVLKVDNSYITPDMVGDYYALAGTPQYLMIDAPLPSEAFEVAAHISYKDLIGREKKLARKVLMQLQRELGGELEEEGELVVDQHITRVTNTLKRLGWSLKERGQWKWGGKIITVYSFEKDNQKLTVRRQGPKTTRISYYYQFEV